MKLKFDVIAITGDAIRSFGRQFDRIVFPCCSILYRKL